MLAELKVTGDLGDICTGQKTAVNQCIDEVLQECSQCSDVAEFDELLSRYKVPTETETKSPDTTRTKSCNDSPSKETHFPCYHHFM